MYVIYFKEEVNVNCENDTQQGLEMEAGGIHEPDTIKATEYHTSILKEQSSANRAEVDNRETSKEK